MKKKRQRWRRRKRQMDVRKFCPEKGEIIPEEKAG